MKSKVVYVLRHGQTEWNLAGRMQGRMDSPLTALGEAQADAHGALLKSLGGVDELWVSSANRTRATAALVNKHLTAPMRYSDHLLERDCGTWSGKTLEEVAASEPDNWSVRKSDPYHHRPGGGENLLDLGRRFNRLLDDFEPVERLAIVAHGVVSKAILQHFLGLDEAQTIAVKHPNSLLYRLSVGVSGVKVTHFVAQASGASQGLDLQHTAQPVEGVLGHEGEDVKQQGASAAMQSE